MLTHRLPSGYEIVWLSSATACYWRNAKGESGPTFRWRDDATYVLACRQDAHRHAAGIRQA